MAEQQTSGESDPALPPELGLLRNEHIGALLGQSFRLFESIALGLLRDRGFTDLRMPHLMLLRHLPPEGMRTSDIAALAGVTPQAIGQIANELEAAGYVVRTPDPSDARAKLAKFTPRGLEFIAVLPQILRGAEGEIERRLGPEIFVVLKGALRTLAVDSRPR